MKAAILVVILSMCGCGYLFGPPVHKLTYSSAGAIHSHKRVKAIKQMYETCKGDYTVVSENPVKVASDKKPFWITNNMNWEIVFTCVGDME